MVEPGAGNFAIEDSRVVDDTRMLPQAVTVSTLMDHWRNFQPLHFQTHWVKMVGDLRESVSSRYDSAQVGPETSDLWDPLPHGCGHGHVDLYPCPELQKFSRPCLEAVVASVHEKAFQAPDLLFQVGDAQRKGRRKVRELAETGRIYYNRRHMAHVHRRG